MYQRIYEEFLFLTRRCEQNGRILRNSRGMNGSAGLSPSRNRKPEGSTSNGCARNLRKEYAGLVVGRAVLTADKDDLAASTFIEVEKLGCPRERSILRLYPDRFRRWLLA